MDFSFPPLPALISGIYQMNPSKCISTQALMTLSLGLHAPTLGFEFKAYSSCKYAGCKHASQSSCLHFDTADTLDMFLYGAQWHSTVRSCCSTTFMVVSSS